MNMSHDSLYIGTHSDLILWQKFQTILPVHSYCIILVVLSHIFYCNYSVQQSLFLTLRDSLKRLFLTSLSLTFSSKIEERGDNKTRRTRTRRLEYKKNKFHHKIFLKEKKLAKDDSFSNLTIALLAHATKTIISQQNNSSQMLVPSHCPSM